MEPAWSLLLTGPGRLEWIVEELRAPGPGEVLVRTTAGAVSAGTEAPRILGTARGEAATYPRMTGYESLGVVQACGPGVARLRSGDRVLAFYGHRTHAVVPAAKAISAPAHISDDLALLAILSCDAAKGVRALAPRYDEAALITGAGTMGILTLFMLRALGLEAVDVTEPRAERHDLALRLGARRVLLPEEAGLLGDSAYDLGFECSGRDAAFALLQAWLRPGGRLCVLSDGNLEPLTLTPDFHRKELQVRGSSDGWDYHRHAAWFFGRISPGPHPLSDLFDLCVDAVALPDRLVALANGDISPRKVLVSYPSEWTPPSAVDTRSGTARLA